MSVRFIIGRAGMGKTHHCLESVRQQIRENPLEGPRLILLVPEQASMQMEREILEPPASLQGDIEPIAVHRGEVLSFQRLAYRVFNSAGLTGRETISESARSMVLRYLAMRRGDQLQYYRRVVRSGETGLRVGGFFQRLSHTISELIQEAVDPEALLSQVEDSNSDGTTKPGSVSDVAAPVDSIQRAKLHDLSLIYQDYIEYLGDERHDPSQYLSQARLHLDACDWLTGAQFWVDGFASLSAQEAMLLVEISRRCAHMEITLLLDPSLAEPEKQRPSPATQHLYQKTQRTFLDLRDRFLREGVEVDQPLILQMDRPPRFQKRDRLADMEKRWDEALTLGPADEGNEPDLTQQPSHELEITALPTRRIEIDYAVSKICQWVQQDGLRYRDTAIIVRDLDPYHDLTLQALESRGIPYFLDRRRPIAHHPLAELIRAALALTRDDFSLESLRILLKTDLIKLSREEADRLENYLIAHGIKGQALWEKPWSYEDDTPLLSSKGDTKPNKKNPLKQINEIRLRFLSGFEPWLSFAGKTRKANGTEWAGALRKLLDELCIEETLLAWALAAEGDGELEQAEAHRQVFRELDAFLEDLSSALSDESLTLRELVDVVETGLSGLAMGLIPPTVDQVLVGSIERSRHPAIKAAVVMGFNEGIFPAKPSEDSILNDDDRDRLIESGVPIQPGTRDRIVDEGLLAYVALTRASESLVITYALTDCDGAELRPSPYVETVLAACPGLKVNHLGDPALGRATWDVLTWRDLTSRLAMEFRHRPTQTEDVDVTRSRWNGLYESYRHAWRDDPVSRRVMLALGNPAKEKISVGNVERLHPGTLKSSVSQLETYAACPFQHFTRYVLRLNERQEAQLKPMDIGQVHHAVLEDFVEGLAQQGKPFDALSESDLVERLNDSCQRVADRINDTGTMSDARNAYVLRRSAEDLARILRAQRMRSASGKTHPKAVELAFGGEDGQGLPALKLKTPAGRSVLLRGFIDRLDIVELADEWLGVVIDYKRTRHKKLDLSRVYHGLSLQLVAYLLALAESGQSLAGRPIRPIGALYVSLMSQYKKLNHPDEFSDKLAQSFGTEKPRGLIRADEFHALESSSETGASPYYSVYTKKDGSLGNLDKTDSATASDFDAVMDRTRFQLGLLADQMLDGDVGIKPFRLGTFSPCSWCAMSSVCRWEMGLTEVRFLESFKRSDIFRMLAQKDQPDDQA